MFTDSLPPTAGGSLKDAMIVKALVSFLKLRDLRCFVTRIVIGCTLRARPQHM